MSGQTNLLSLLMVVAILAILGAAGWGFYYGASTNINLEEEQKKIFAALRQAKANAIYGEDYSDWGVHFENPPTGDSFYEVFKGSSYPAAILKIKTYLSTGVDFGLPSGPLNGDTKNIIFPKRTGKTNVSQAVTILLINDTTKTRNILISVEGLIYE